MGNKSVPVRLDSYLSDFGGFDFLVYKEFCAPEVIVSHKDSRKN